MPYASWFSRVGAYLVDALITAIPIVVGGGIGTAIGLDTGAGKAVLIIFYVAGFVVAIYNRYILGGRTGQTWGRKALGIRLVSEEQGQPIGGGLTFVRDLAHIVDGIPCDIGYLWPLWDAKRQTFADKIMRTVVVAA
jgi:uncharacterized RDD family membrane protein YckC